MVKVCCCLIEVCKDQLVIWQVIFWKNANEWCINSAEMGAKRIYLGNIIDILVHRHKIE